MSQILKDFRKDQLALCVRLESLLKKQEISIRSAAFEMKINPTTLYDFLGNKRTITFKVLAKVENYLTKYGA
jgi:plasmid maintenance system antidote protein VapI